MSLRRSDHPPMSQPAPDKIAGLDTIRFMCALWVVMSHIGMPPGLPSAAVSGPAAVIVFFVISGFCIHHPFKDGPPPSWPRYYARRYVRIGVPLIAAVAIAGAFNLSFKSFEATILWSLFAELIYYTLYPFLRALGARFGWWPLIGVAYAAGLAVALSNPLAGNYPSFGVGLTWLLGLPCWLLGCRLAEVAGGLVGRADGRIWLWRLGIWAASCVCMWLRFHTPVGYPITLNLFAILVFVWLGREIAHFKVAREWPVLAWAGAWSYSLYLMHEPIHRVFRMQIPAGLPPSGRWAVSMALVLVGTYVFYRLVERPAHHLARRASRWRITAPLSAPPAVEQSHV